jgi:hypothetical protein
MNGPERDEMLPFEQWLALHRLAVADLPRYGDFPAVYVLRDAATKDILKFGKAQWLRQRIFGNYLGGVGGETTQRIHHALFSGNVIDGVELAWLETRDEQEAKRKEDEFRNAYKKKHGRRPAWDRQG